jgi:SAM-dependent methyltransferase
MDSIIPHFDAILADYERFAEPATAAFGAHALAMLAVRPGEQVLDIAAGTGALALPLLAAGARLTATDLSSPMVERIRARLADEPRATVQVENGEALSFDDASFDAAISMFGVMLFPDFRAGLREMTRVLRHGGRAVVGSWTGVTAPMRLLADAAAIALPGRISPSMPAGVDVLGTEQGMKAALTAAGLEQVRTARVTMPWTSPPVDALLARPHDFFAHMPPVQSLTDGERERLYDAMRALFAADPMRDFTSSAVIGLASKPADPPSS